jgi:hypothetical protein
LTDQAALVRVATEGKDPRLSDTVLGKITDQAAMATIAEDGGHTGVRLAVIGSIREKDTLQRLMGVSKSHTDKIAGLRSFLIDPDVERRLGVTRMRVDWQPTSASYAGLVWGNKPGEVLTITIDQGTLKAPIKGSWGSLFPAETKTLDFTPAYVNTGDLVVKLLADASPSEVSSLMLDGACSYLRRAAVEKLTDQTMLARIAVADEDSLVRLSAAFRLTDPETLARVAIEGRDSKIGCTLVERLTDRVLLKRVADEGNDPGVREAASKLLLK